MTSAGAAAPIVPAITETRRHPRGPEDHENTGDPHRFVVFHRQGEDPSTVGVMATFTGKGPGAIRIHLVLRWILLWNQAMADPHTMVTGKMGPVVVTSSIGLARVAKLVTKVVAEQAPDLDRVTSRTTH